MAEQVGSAAIVQLSAREALTALAIDVPTAILTAQRLSIAGTPGDTSLKGLDGADNPVVAISGGGVLDGRPVDTVQATLEVLGLEELARKKFEERRWANQIYEYSPEGYRIKATNDKRKFYFEDSLEREVYVEEGHRLYFFEKGTK